jgi:hypothetical protein
MSRRWWVVGLFVLVAAVMLGRRWVDGPDTRTPASAADRDWSPLGRSVEVEVLNAGGVSGSARDASLRLRRAGLDVVYWGNAREADRDTTPRPPRILVRRGDTAGVGRVQEVLGEAEVVARPDSVPMVDLTVIVWRDSVR